mmetsp:Transcript_44257/g.172294  ORF Transcript_44257/g.172294 Transcript_44257/m.172294 type:complete len:89 (+) Transcript_44257:189-455(+)
MLLWVPVALFSAVGAYVLMRYRRVVRESREEVDLSAAVIVALRQKVVELEEAFRAAGLVMRPAGTPSIGPSYEVNTAEACVVDVGANG